MNLIIEQLHEDHKQLVRILYHLEREIKALSGLTNTPGSLEALLDILDYIQVYPEIWHHPTEDVIYQMLQEKAIPGPDLLTEAIEEHAVLELLTDNLQQYVNASATGQQLSSARFIKSAGDYVSRQLRHMEQEQTILFPLAEKYLNKNDWEKIKQQLKDRQYSLEEPRLQKYKNFYEGMANSSVVTAH